MNKWFCIQQFVFVNPACYYWIVLRTATTLWTGASGMSNPGRNKRFSSSPKLSRPVVWLPPPAFCSVGTGGKAARP